MAAFDYPLLLKPIPVPRPWGGGRLPSLFNRESVVASEPIGESWDVSTWPKDPGNPELQTVTRIINGPLAGALLDQVVGVPVVIKLLDSAQRLSVQNHPVSDEIHKDEMWFILHAEPDAYLYCGLEDGVSPEDFCKVVRSNSASEQEIIGSLKRHDNLKPGMFYNVPSGTVHAVGPGLVVFEVSESTQITYRLYDYNRGRALHVDEGCAAMRALRNIGECLNPQLNITGTKAQETLTEFPTFKVVKVTGADFYVEGCSHTHLITPTLGGCHIQGADENWDIWVNRASSCLVPDTSSGYRVLVSEGEEVLLTLLNM